MFVLTQSNTEQLPLLGLAIEIRNLIGVSTPARGWNCLNQRTVGLVTNVTRLRIYPGRPGFGQSAPMIWSGNKSRSLGWKSGLHGHVREAQPNY